MSDFENFQVALDATGKGEVWMNGQPLKGVRAVSFRSSVDEPTELTITFIANVNCVE